MSDWCARLQGEGDALAVMKDRPRDDPVRQVVASGDIGVIQQKHVLVLDGVAEGFDQGSQRQTAAARVDGDAIGLTDENAVRVAQKTREIVTLAEDRAACRACHDPAHLPGDVIQAVLYESQPNGVGGRHHGSREIR